jgi:hypothetical protein
MPKVDIFGQPYDALISKYSYTSVEKSVAKSAKLEIRDELQTKELAHRFFDGSELEFYPKGEHTGVELRNNLATIYARTTKDVLEDLPQRVEKSELLPIEKSKKEEEHFHFYSMEVSHQRFEDKIENVQRVIKDAISVKVDFREDFRPPTAQEVQNLIESLSKVGFRMDMLSLNGRNLYL